MNTINLYLFELHQWLDQADLSLLSDEEKSRHARFATPELKQHFATCHTLKRLLLSEHLSCSAQMIAFERTNNGKPQISQIQNPADIEFNLSHSDDFLLIGLSRKNPIGVDIEQARQNDYFALARRFFHHSEIEAIETSKDPKQTFYEIWVQKEAYLKMSGKGISAGLDNFSVLEQPETQIIQCENENLFAAISTSKPAKTLNLQLNCF